MTVNPTAAREQGWQVPSWADPAETPVFLAGRGLVLLRDDGTTTPAHQVELGETA